MFSPTRIRLPRLSVALLSIPRHSTTPNREQTTALRFKVLCSTTRAARAWCPSPPRGLTRAAITRTAQPSTCKPRRFFPPAQNGTWGGTFTVPNYQLTGLPKNGTWSLINITAIDLAGNVALYSRGKAQESGFPTSFEVHLPSPMACLDVSYPTAQVDVKKADNPSQMATVPFNCTTTAAPANSNTLRCYVYFQCYDENWVSGTGTPRAPSLTDFTGTMQIVDWYYETGACNLEGIITSYNGPSGGTIMELYGRADPLTMRLLFPDAAATVLASPLVLLLSFALAFFLAK